MKTFKFESCPVCQGELVYSKMTCKNCASEFPVNDEISIYDKLNEAQKDFLELFLKSRGNIKTICQKTELSYPTIKRKLDELLESLNLSEDKEEVSGDLSNFGEIDYDSKKPSDIVKRKLYEAGGRIDIKLLDGKDCIVIATEGGKSITSDKLNNYTLKYDYSVFDIIVDLLKNSKDGKAPKGNSFGKEDKVGQGKCTPDTIVGYIAINYSHKKYGESAYDPVFVLAAILDWANIAQNCRGFVQLNEEFRKENNMDKLAIEFQNELQDKVFEAKKEYKYNASYFNQMIAQYGGVMTAKKLIEKAVSTGNPSEGYTKLFMLGRLDLSMEDSVCKEKYRSLFTEEEVNYCMSLLNR